MRSDGGPANVPTRRATNILWIGNAWRREFREARRVASRWAHVVEASDAASAQILLAETELVFDWIVLATAYPGQYSADQVDALGRLAPLSRIVALLGSWCEGETRSGRPLPGVIRVYWHQWEQRLACESAQRGRGVRSTWDLPITATEEERILALAESSMTRRSGLIVVCSSDVAVQDWLAAACRQAGFRVRWARPGDSIEGTTPSIALFDASDRAGQYVELAQFADAVRPAPVVALMTFPRYEDQEQALAAGAAAVLAKPIWLEDLLWEIDRLMSEPRRRRA